MYPHIFYDSKGNTMPGTVGRGRRRNTSSGKNEFSVFVVQMGREMFTDNKSTQQDVACVTRWRGRVPLYGKV